MSSARLNIWKLLDELWEEYWYWYSVGATNSEVRLNRPWYTLARETGSPPIPQINC